MEEALGERGGLGNDSGGPRWFVLRRGWGWGAAVSWSTDSEGGRGAQIGPGGHGGLGTVFRRGEGRGCRWEDPWGRSPRREMGIPRTAEEKRCWVFWC